MAEFIGNLFVIGMACYVLWELAGQIECNRRAS